MKTLVIYHKADFDGLFSREVCRLALGDTADYLGWDYGDPIPSVETDRPVVMVDISVDGLMDHRPLTWIDHHKSAMEKFPTDIPGYRIDGVAACRLAWQWFCLGETQRAPGEPLPSKQQYIDRQVIEPYSVRLAGEYDIWDKRDPNVDLFQSGLRSLDLECHWGELLSMRRPAISEVEALVDSGFKTDLLLPDGTFIPPIVHTILANGRVLKYAGEKANESLMADVAFDLDWEGLHFLALNKPRANSMTFSAGVKPEHDALLTFYWLRNKWRISLYHAPHRTDIDLSMIAVKYGGGGHRGACGFEMKELPFALA